MAARARVRFGEFTLDVVGRRLRRGDADVPLQPQVFATLAHLVAHADRTLTKQELLETLWPDAVVGEAALTRCVRQIREALGDDAREPRFVKTVPRVGFRFVARIGRVAGDAPPDPRVIAVLPFRPLLPDRRDESLELGMAETLITRLSALPGVVVRALSTVRGHAGPERDPLEVGRDLGVDAVVDASLQHSEERLRVQVRMLDVSSGGALLSESFDEAFHDVFALQDALCRRIARAVSAEAGRQASERRSARETDDPAAYADYLRGRLVLASQMPADAARSISHFERALRRDPCYALALSSISEAWIARATGEGDTEKCFTEARGAAEAALGLDDRLGSAWACLATVAFQYDWDWEHAQHCFDRAVAHAPSFIEMWCAYASFLWCTGRPEEAVDVARHAVEIDPASPMAGAWLAQAYQMAGRPRESIAAAQATLKRSPGFPFATFVLGLSCLMDGSTGEAIEWLEQASRSRADFGGALAGAYVRAGRLEAAADIEATILPLVESGRVPAFALAPIYAERGDEERFFEIFERVFEQRGWQALMLVAEPVMFARYREHPRAKELIARLHLPSADSAA